VVIARGAPGAGRATRQAALWGAQGQIAIDARFDEPLPETELGGWTLGRGCCSIPMPRGTLLPCGRRAGMRACRGLLERDRAAAPFTERAYPAPLTGLGLARVQNARIEIG
jgi:hypothetical protein